jgi:hypothetical protein
LRVEVYEIQKIYCLIYFTAIYVDRDLVEIYNIGSTIHLGIHPSDPSRNKPVHLLRLTCGDVGRIEEDNIPSPVPPSVITWRHTSLDGKSAFFAINRAPDEIDDVTYMPPEEFIEASPRLVGPDSPFTVATDAGKDSSALDFSVANITLNFLDVDYLNLRNALGWWECTLSNSLGTQTERTFISVSCEFCN